MDNNNTLFVGKVLHRFDTVSSTNEVAAEYLTKSAPTEGTVISASFQRAGKGQIGSSWESRAGENLLQSVILYPRFLEPKRAYLLNLAVSLAVRDWAAACLTVPVWVKWPNDIIVNGGKLAGILIQNSLRGGRVQQSVVGMGVNVNQTDFQPYELPATSLAAISQKTYTLPALEPSLWLRVEQRYLQLKAGDEAALKHTYLDHLWQRGKTNTFRRADGSVFTGRITGINETGKLCISGDAGEEVFGLKEVKMVDGEW